MRASIHISGHYVNGNLSPSMKKLPSVVPEPTGMTNAARRTTLHAARCVPPQNATCRETLSERFRAFKIYTVDIVDREIGGTARNPSARFLNCNSSAGGTAPRPPAPRSKNRKPSAKRKRKTTGELQAGKTRTADRLENYPRSQVGPLGHHRRGCRQRRRGRET